MREPTLTYPLHISQLMQDLVCGEVESALLKRRSLLQCDLPLRNAFTHLGFQYETGKFARNPSAAEAIAAISKEFEDLGSGTGEEEAGRPMSPFEMEMIREANTLVSPIFPPQWSLISPSDPQKIRVTDPLLSLTPVQDLDEPCLSVMWSPDLVTSQASLNPAQKIVFSPSPFTPERHTSSISDLFSPEPSGSRANRGLKSLSKRVLQSIRTHGKLTYQEVADELVDRESWQGGERDKEEKNIRRRAYDAINVLVAAGTLKKQGKQVVAVPVPPNPKSKDKSDIQSRVDLKYRTLRQVAEICVKLRVLLARNRSRPCSDCIKFPLFLVAAADSRKNAITLVVNSTGSWMRLKSRKPTYVYRDTDLLSFLPLPTITDVLPIEVQRLLSDFEETTREKTAFFV